VGVQQSVDKPYAYNKDGAGQKAGADEAHECATE
jgi:hypothetical protein